MAFGAPAERLTDERTILAVGFAVAVLASPADIPEAAWDELRRNFSDGELVELVFLVCQYIGIHLFAYLMAIDPPERGK